MSIPLPPLPRPDAVTEIYTGHGYKDVWTVATARARDQEIVRCVLAAAAKVLTEHQIPVGNSAAGELACQWTYAALKECRDTIKSLEFHHE